MIDNKEASQPRVPSVAWVITCGVMCAGILIYGAGGGMGVLGSAAYQAGASLPKAAVLAGLLHWMFGRRRAPFLGWIGFALIYGCFVVAASMSADRSKRELRSELEDMTKTMQAIESADKSGAPLPPQMAVSSAAAGSDGQKMGVALKTIMNRMLAVRTDYEREIEAMGFAQVLDPQRLHADKNLVKTKALVANARSTVARYRARVSDLVVQARRDIENAGLDAENTRAALAGFDAKADKGKAQILETWDMEAELVEDFDKVVTILDQAKGWRVENGGFVFQRNADVAQFNAAIKKLQAAAAQQEELNAAALRRSQESLSKISSLTN